MDNTLDTAYLIGAIVGALFIGAVCGLIPLIAGLIKKRIALAVSGFIVCMICGFILGVILALPVAIIFLVVILLTSKDKKEPETSSDDVSKEV